MLYIQIELKKQNKIKQKNRAKGKLMARNMTFLVTGFLSRFLFFCIMTPICPAPVVLGNDSFLIASTEAWTQ